MQQKYVRIGMEVNYRGAKHNVSRKADNGSYMLSIGDSFTYAFADEFEPYPLPSTHARRTEEYNKAMAQLNEISVQLKTSEIKTPKHYDNTDGSLYLFADKHKLNSYEFDILKRLVRCRKKGEFISDIKKTIHVLELYLKEQSHLYENETKNQNK